VSLWPNKTITSLPFSSKETAIGLPMPLLRLDCHYRDIRLLLRSPMAPLLRHAIAEAKQRWSVIGGVIKNLLFQALCFGRHVKPLVPVAFASLAPTNPLWACVVGYGPFSLCVIHKKGLCLSSGDINKLIMMMWLSLEGIN
jgi:hypothetical protein